MERLHSLKQRESLIKGMGVDEIVYKILSGTNGTVAAYPGGVTVAAAAAALLNNGGGSNAIAQSTSNTAAAAAATAAAMAAATNSMNNRINSVHFNDSSDTSLRNNFSSKLELRTKNFNPFENEHSLLAEVTNFR